MKSNECVPAGSDLALDTNSAREKDKRRLKPGRVGSRPPVISAAYSQPWACRCIALTDTICH